MMRVALCSYTSVLRWNSRIKLSLRARVAIYGLYIQMKMTRKIAYLSLSIDVDLRHECVSTCTGHQGQQCGGRNLHGGCRQGACFRNSLQEKKN